MLGGDVRKWREKWRLRGVDLTRAWGISTTHLYRIETEEVEFTEQAQKLFKYATLQLALKYKNFNMVEDSMLADVLILGEMAHVFMEKVKE